MIVHCPSCSTGYHLALPPPAAVLRCSLCREVVPPPAHRRRYVLATPAPMAATSSKPVLGRAAKAVAPALPVRAVAQAPPPPTPAMPALDAAVFGPGGQVPSISVRSPGAGRRPAPADAEPEGATALVPLGLAAVGAAAAWFAAPRLSAWMPPFPFALEPWMMGAVGAVCGLLLGGVWMGWRAGRR